MTDGAWVVPASAAVTLLPIIIYTIYTTRKGETLMLAENFYDACMNNRNGFKADPDIAVRLSHLARVMTFVSARKALEDDRYWERNALLYVLDVTSAWLKEEGADPREVLAEGFRHAKSKHGDRTFDKDLPHLDRVAAYIEELGELARALTYDKEHANEVAAELADIGELTLAWLANIEGVVLE